MKKIIIAVATSIILSLTSLNAQDLLRSSYKYNGFTHISSEFSEIKCDHPFWERLEYVAFPDNTYAYVLHINFEDKKGYHIPKGVKMALTTPDGKIVRADQMSAGNSRSFDAGKGKVYWNSADYMLTEADVEKIVKGVRSIDVITGWEPEDYFKINFAGNEFASALARQHQVIKDAPRPKDEVDDTDIVRFADNNASITVLTKAQVAKGERFIYNVALNYLYYKTTNKEDFDLNFMIGSEAGYDIPVGSKVTFTLTDGSVIALQQEREQTNVVYCYPTADQVKAICRGVKSISIVSETGLSLTDNFPGNAFSEAVAKLYRTLMAVAVL